MLGDVVACERRTSAQREPCSPPEFTRNPGKGFVNQEHGRHSAFACLLCSLLQAVLPKTTLSPFTFTGPRPQTTTPRKHTHGLASLETLARGQCREPHGLKSELRDARASQQPREPTSPAAAWAQTCAAH